MAQSLQPEGRSLTIQDEILERIGPSLLSEGVASLLLAFRQEAREEDRLAREHYKDLKERLTDASNKLVSAVNLLVNSRSAFYFGPSVIQQCEELIKRKVKGRHDARILGGSEGSEHLSALDAVEGYLLEIINRDGSFAQRGAIKPGVRGQKAKDLALDKKTRTLRSLLTGEKDKFDSRLEALLLRVDEAVKLVPGLRSLESYQDFEALAPSLENLRANGASSVRSIAECVNQLEEGPDEKTLSGVISRCVMDFDSQETLEAYLIDALAKSEHSKLQHLLNGETEKTPPSKKRTSSKPSSSAAAKVDEKQGKKRTGASGTSKSKLASKKDASSDSSKPESSKADGPRRVTFMDRDRSASGDLALQRARLETQLEEIGISDGELSEKIGASLRLHDFRKVCSDLETVLGSSERVGLLISANVDLICDPDDYPKFLRLLTETKENWMPGLDSGEISIDKMASLRKLKKFSAKSSSKSSATTRRPKRSLKQTTGKPAVAKSASNPASSRVQKQAEQLGPEQLGQPEQPGQEEPQELSQIEELADLASRLQEIPDDRECRQGFIASLQALGVSIQSDQSQVEAVLSAGLDGYEALLGRDISAMQMAKVLSVLTDLGLRFPAGNKFLIERLNPSHGYSYAVLSIIGPRLEEFVNASFDNKDFLELERLLEGFLLILQSPPSPEVSEIAASHLIEYGEPCKDRLLAALRSVEESKAKDFGAIPGILIQALEEGLED